MSAYQLPAFVWPSAVMAVGGIAIWRGRNYERLAAGGLIAAWALSLVAYERQLQTQWGILAVDLSMMALLCWVVLKSRRFWPMFAAGFHLLAILTHLARGLDPTFGGWTYMTAELIWGYLVASTIGYGAWTAPNRQEAYDAEADVTPPGATLR